jgi:hypothetical protein
MSMPLNATLFLQSVCETALRIDKTHGGVFLRIYANVSFFKISSLSAPLSFAVPSKVPSWRMFTLYRHLS